MSPLEFSAMFMLGLVSSLHCVQMCGPIVLSYSVALESLSRKTRAGSEGRASAETREPLAIRGRAALQGRVSRIESLRALAPVVVFDTALLQNHLAYNAGRILIYSALGAIAGFAGGTLGILGRLAGFTHTLAIVAGISMIVVGISLFGLIPAGVLANRLFRIPSSFLRHVGRLLSTGGSSHRFLLGLALGFLPCGLIYAALLKALATGSAFNGAATMLAFGLGTAGALLALGMFSSAIRMRLNRWGSQLAAVGVTLMGVALVWRASMPTMLMMGGHMHGHH